MRSILQHTLSLVAAVAVGSLALVGLADQSAYAAGGGGDHQQSQKSQQGSQHQQQASMKTTQQKAEYFQSWSKSEKPGQAYNEYASSGLMLIYSTIDGVASDLKNQPVGGGPSQQQGQQQKSQKIQQALQDIQSKHQRLKSMADRIEKSSEVMDHPRQFRQAASTVATILGSLQQAKFSGLSKDVDKVRDAANKLRANQPLASQKKDIKSFFSRTSDVVNKMSTQLQKDQQATGGGPSEQGQQQHKNQDQMQKNQQRNMNQDQPSDSDMQQDQQSQ